MSARMEESTPLLRSRPLCNPSLPRWFTWAVSVSVLLSVAWIGGLVVVQNSSRQQTDAWLSSATSVTGVSASNLSLYAGVMNSMLGSFLSASGYCCQKWAHTRVQLHPALGVASQQRVFMIGLLLLAIGTISAVLNLGILGQAVQAPFAALTLIYSAVLGRCVLQEPLLLWDLTSSLLIIAGVAVDVYVAAHKAHSSPPSYSLQSLGALIFRDSFFPGAYTVVSITYTTLMLRQVHHHNLHQRAIGLLAFSSCAGIMAGFTSLATKSALEVLKSTLHHHQAWEQLLSPFFLAIVAAIPAALIPQLFFLNKGLEYFGTLKFIPLYQAFIILGNMVCGMVFYNEMVHYSPEALVGFLVGIVITLSGVCMLLAKVDGSRIRSDQLTEHVVVQVADIEPRPQLQTTFRFEDMEWITGDMQVLEDFQACKRVIVDLLSSASKSIYYSTFLCDFTQVLAVDPVTGEKQTFLSCLEAAVARGVAVHILYNPVRDYGTASLTDLERLLPTGVVITCAVSDLGPSLLTKWFSNNSKYAFHHQKYLCIDDDRLMVTGCDVNTEREGWLCTNRLGYYWHELSVVCPCPRSMAQWIHNNHVPNTTRRHYDQFLAAPPFPFVAGGWNEENAMVNMILVAQQSIHLENQILISGGTAQHNRICDALVDRIVRAHRERDVAFRVLILTNAAQQDEPSIVTRWYCSISIQWSLEQMEARALDQGLSLEALRQYLVVGRLESQGVLIKVHSNILITDGYYALRSSSNLADRSLSARPTDTELGVLFAGPVVQRLQQTLFNMYLSTSGINYAMPQVCDRLFADGCLIVPLTKKEWSPVLTWFLMQVFIYGSEGATGGRYKVHYSTFSTTKAKPPHAAAAYC